MTKKLLIGLSVLMAAGFAASSPASAGAGTSARAHMKVPVKSLAKTVAFRPNAIRRSLRKRGYYNIHFTDRQLPVYKVRACRNGKKFSLRLNRWGDVNRRVKVGRCGGHVGPRMSGLSFPELRHKLRNRGYDSIRFTDRRLPGYGAKACKNGRRFALRLNRWGKIINRDRRGSCGYGNHRGPRHGHYGRIKAPGITITLGRGYRH